MLKTVSSITNAIGALNYKGTWNANTNTPALASGVGTKGDYYVVSVAGTTALDGISNWGVGDWVTFNGSVWQRVEGGADLNGVNVSFTGVATGPIYDAIGSNAGPAYRLANWEIIRYVNAVLDIGGWGASQWSTLRLWANGSIVGEFGSAGAFTCAGVYATTIGATNRDVFVDNTGLVGYVSSTRASKTNIKPLESVDWLLNLNPVEFNYREKDEAGNYTNVADGNIQNGLIAEEVESVREELCFYDVVDGKKVLRGVSYSKLVIPLLKMMQQQQSEIKSLQEQIQSLKGN